MVMAENITTGLLYGFTVTYIYLAIDQNTLYSGFEHSFNMLIIQNKLKKDKLINVLKNKYFIL